MSTCPASAAQPAAPCLDSEAVMADVVRGAVDLAGVWRALFAEHASSGESMVSACARHGVSAGSWYFWKRKLGIAPRRRAAKRGSGFAELVV